MYTDCQLVAYNEKKSNRIGCLSNVATVEAVTQVGRMILPTLQLAYIRITRPARKRIRFLRE